MIWWDYSLSYRDYYCYMGATVWFGGTTLCHIGTIIVIWALLCDLVGPLSVISGLLLLSGRYCVIWWDHSPSYRDYYCYMGATVWFGGTTLCHIGTIIVIWVLYCVLCWDHSLSYRDHPLPHWESIVDIITYSLCGVKGSTIVMGRIHCCEMYSKSPIHGYHIMTQRIPNCHIKQERSHWLLEITRSLDTGNTCVVI